MLCGFFGCRLYRPWRSFDHRFREAASGLSKRGRNANYRPPWTVMHEILISGGEQNDDHALPRSRLAFDTVIVVIE